MRANARFPSLGASPRLSLCLQESPPPMPRAAQRSAVARATTTLGTQPRCFEIVDELVAEIVNSNHPVSLGLVHVAEPTEPETGGLAEKGLTAHDDRRRVPQRGPNQRPARQDELQERSSSSCAPTARRTAFGASDGARRATPGSNATESAPVSLVRPPSRPTAARPRPQPWPHRRRRPAPGQAQTRRPPDRALPTTARA